MPARNGTQTNPIGTPTALSFDADGNLLMEDEKVDVYDADSNLVASSETITLPIEE